LSGLSIFKTNCASCHATDLFTDGSFRNNGLEIYSRDPDLGRYLITQNIEDKYKFKVPSLRNVEYTSPYMHDGRFINLKLVIEHYDSGVNDSPTLDPEVKKGKDLGLQLSDQDKLDLLAFLKTLSDSTFLKEPAYAAP
jgi:cytochrome c peroxidase